MSGALQIPQEAREVVAIRDGHYCARCGRSITNAPASVHHRYLRGLGGSRDPRVNDYRNLVRLCGSGTTGCHGHVHAHPAQSREHGWIIRSLDDLDTPMRTKFGSRIELSADGTRRDTWPFDDPILPLG